MGNSRAGPRWLAGESARRKHESQRRRPFRTWKRVELLSMQPAASSGNDRLGGGASSCDPGHHLGEVRAIGEDRCPLYDRATGPMRACQPGHQSADLFVVHTSQATPLAS